MWLKGFLEKITADEKLNVVAWNWDRIEIGVWRYEQERGQDREMKVKTGYSFVVNGGIKTGEWTEYLCVRRITR